MFIVTSRYRHLIKCFKYNKINHLSLKQTPKLPVDSMMLHALTDDSD